MEQTTKFTYINKSIPDIPELIMLKSECSDNISELLNNLDSTYNSNLPNTLSQNKSNQKQIIITNTICRICLQTDAESTLFSILTFEDGSSLDVAQVFQKLTGESSERINNPKMPQQICNDCIDLLVHAYKFQKTYEKSSQIIKDFVSKEVTTDDVFPDTISKTTASTTEDIMAHYKENNSSEFLEASNFTGEKNKIGFNKFKSRLGNLPNNGKLHGCPICFKKFTALELKQHCRSHDSLKQYFSLAPVFNKKVRFYATPKDNICLFYKETVCHNCPFCLEDFKGEDFRDHVKTHKVDGNFRCNVCNRIFLGRNHLKMHQLKHKKEAPFKCEECGKEFFLKKNFEFHQYTHLTVGQLPFQCEHCPKSFSNPEHLKRHNFAHEKAISYHGYYPNKQTFLTCKRCLQKFKTQQELLDHFCTVTCEKCNKAFPSKKEFSNHVCKYKNKRYKCTCGKEFVNFLPFKEHTCKLKSRSLCSICGKNVSNLKTHLLSHYPEKRTEIYNCDICGKEFKFKESLFRHVKVQHGPETTYYCQFCSKEFQTKAYVKMHERTHMGTKEHYCDICGASFLYKVYLKRHQTKVHRKIDSFSLPNTKKEDQEVKEEILMGYDEDEDEFLSDE